MLLLLGVACAAAREAPTSLRVLNDELDGYFRRRLDGEGLEPAPANGTTPPTGVPLPAVDQGSFDESARTKDFKPGTNAQRHRFYHNH